MARAMHATPLRDYEIVIGKADTPGPGDVRGAIDSITELSVFKGKCPLWTYILVEAARNRELVTTPKLGPVGSRILAEVFLGLVFGGSDLLKFDPQWQPPSGLQAQRFGRLRTA
jgi:hypothetical protein